MAATLRTQSNLRIHKEKGGKREQCKRIRQGKKDKKVTGKPTEGKKKKKSRRNGVPANKPKGNNRGKEKD